MIRLSELLLREQRTLAETQDDPGWVSHEASGRIRYWFNDVWVFDTKDAAMNWLYERANFYRQQEEPPYDEDEEEEGDDGA